MALAPYTTPAGFVLPSIHSAPPFFTQQPNPGTQSIQTGHWIRLVLSYARFRRLFVLRVEDAEGAPGESEWDDVLRNPRIKRRVFPAYLSYLISCMVEQNLASYEPSKQTRSVVLYWRLPEEWAEVLYEWATSTGQLNTILTFYEIVEPQVPSQVSGLPISLLKKAIGILGKSGRAQIIAVSDGEGVRFLAGANGWR